MTDLREIVDKTCNRYADRKFLYWEDPETKETSAITFSEFKKTGLFTGVSPIFSGIDVGNINVIRKIKETQITPDFIFILSIFFFQLYRYSLQYIFMVFQTKKSAF